MTLLDYIDPDSVEDESVREAFESWNERYGHVPLFRKILAHSPMVLNAWDGYYDAIMHGGVVDQRHKELSHVVVSQIGECKYCASSHGAKLVEEFGIPKERLFDIKNGDFGAFDAEGQAVGNLARQIALDPKGVGEEHVTALRDVGFDDEAIIELFVATCSFICATALMDSLDVDPVDQDETLLQYYPES